MLKYDVIKKYKNSNFIQAIGKDNSQVTVTLSLLKN